MGQMNDLLVKIGFDTSSAKKDLDKFESSLDQMVKRLSKSFDSLKQKDNKDYQPFDPKKFKSETQGIVKNLKALGAEVGNLQNRLNATKSPEGLKKIRAEVDKTYNDFTKFQSATNKDIIQDIKYQRKIEEKDTKLKTVIEDDLKALNKLGYQTESLSKKLSKLGSTSDLSAFKKEVREILKEEVTVNKERLAAAKKVSDKINAENKLRYKQALDVNRSLTKEQDKVSKSAKESADIFKEELKVLEKQTLELKKQEALKNKLSKQEVYDRNKSKGLNIQSEIKTRKEESRAAQQNLQKRLVSHKKLKKELLSQESFYQDKMSLSTQLQDKKRYIDNLSSYQDKIRKATTKKDLKAIQAEAVSEIKAAKKVEDAKTSLAEKRRKRVARMEESFRASTTFRGLDLQNQEKALQRFAKIKQRVLLTGDESGFRTLSADIRDFKRQMVGLQTIQGGLQDSTRNLIRSYASLFALMEGTQAIERVGMDFQGMEVAMLASAGSAEKAKSDLKFINDIADEMGVNLKDASDAYVKLQFATKGKMSDEQVKELFFNLNRFATSLKVAPESLKNAQRAIQQMSNKGQIMAEELKGQFAEHLPGGIQLFANALQMSERELFTAMENGELLAAEVLPKVTKELYKASQAGGAYEEALKALRVQKGKFVTESQRAADTIFKSGFEEGLSELYKELSDQLKSTGKSQEDLGNIYNKFFKALKNLVKVATPVLEAFIQVAFKGMDVIASFDKPLQALLYSFKELPSPIKNTTVAVIALSLAMKNLYARVGLIIAGFQEIASYFDDKLVGRLEKSLGHQINIMTGETRQIVTTEEGMFDAGDFVRNVVIDVDAIEGIDDLNKFLEDNNVLFEQIANNMGMSTQQLLADIAKTGKVSEEIKDVVKKTVIDTEGLDSVFKKTGKSVGEWITALNKSETTLDKFTDAVNKAAIGQLDLVKVLTSEQGLTAGFIALAASVWAVVKLFVLGKMLGKGFEKLRDMTRKGPKTGLPTKKTPSPKTSTRPSSKVVSPKTPFEFKEKSRLQKIGSFAKSFAMKSTLPAIGRFLPLLALKGSTDSGTEVLESNLSRMKSELLADPSNKGLRDRIEAVGQEISRRKQESATPNIGLPDLTNLPINLPLQSGMMMQQPVQHTSIEISGIEVNLQEGTPEQALQASEILVNDLSSQLKAFTRKGR